MYYVECPGEVGKCLLWDQYTDTEDESSDEEIDKGESEGAGGPMNAAAIDD